MPEHGQLFTAATSRCELKEVFNPHTSNLDALSAAEIRIQNSTSPPFAFEGEEVLLFNLGSALTARVDGKDYELAHYDVLYVPLNKGFKLTHGGDDPGHVYAYRASGTEVHPVFHSSYADAQKNEERIRHLHRKVVYKMFDVSEGANKFMAGYTFYDDHTRAWPPHNHTDQEEVYSFIEGKGAMTVYEDDENQTFVTSVEVGSHVTIPVLNYHPVFSHDEPLCFIWCIAGERYWVGDKNTDFMKGDGDKITT
jgi:mannose-6-phosphate isomerase-like protein (cupin superfamily)